MTSLATYSSDLGCEFAMVNFASDICKANPGSEIKTNDNDDKVMTSSIELLLVYRLKC